MPGSRAEFGRTSVSPAQGRGAEFDPWLCEVGCLKVYTSRPRTLGPTTGLRLSDVFNHVSASDG